jgi:hypothetical protein
MRRRPVIAYRLADFKRAQFFDKSRAKEAAEKERRKRRISPRSVMYCKRLSGVQYSTSGYKKCSSIIFP